MVPGGRARGGDIQAISIQRRDGRRRQLGMARQPEIIAAGKIEQPVSLKEHFIVANECQRLGRVHGASIICPRETARAKNPGARSISGFTAAAPRAEKKLSAATLLQCTFSGNIKKLFHFFLREPVRPRHRMCLSWCRVSGSGDSRSLPINQWADNDTAA